MAIADSITVLQSVKRDNETPTVENVVRLLPVNIMYYWGDNYRSKKPASDDERITIRYFWGDKNFKLLYRLYDSRTIMSITPVRK
ncbi:hypothetical protein SAMN05216311_1168 [Chitinophaga sp. CF418]|nr:hypothetical protein SAMN05216311_1168 [Chitinophaga sp. CF418]